MRIKLLSYNIHKGKNWTGRKLKIEAIREALRSTNADIVFLQEVVGENIKWQKKYDSWPSESQFEFLADSIWEHFSYAQNAVYQHGHHGNVILSKFPILNWDKVDISTNKFEQRGILLTQVQIADSNSPETKYHNLWLFCVHLNLLHSGRLIQYKKLTDTIIKYAGNDSSVVLAGDFNDWNRKACLSIEYDMNLTECFKSLTGEYANTFPVMFPFLSLDRVYCRGLKILKAEVLKGANWSQLSDHLPLLVEIEVNPKC